mgnify:CR=1 FL=1|tara:strand:+ start:219 stop:386 length:168 start_codon:yes stop_codon:yes gene_type:complete
MKSSLINWSIFGLFITALTHLYQRYVYHHRLVKQKVKTMNLEANYNPYQRYTSPN